MIRFGRWTEQERAYAVAHLESLPPPNAFICKKDRLEAKRHCGDSFHIPKWKKQINNDQENVTYCIHPDCKATSKEDNAHLHMIQ